MPIAANAIERDVLAATITLGIGGDRIGDIANDPKMVTQAIA